MYDRLNSALIEKICRVRWVELDARYVPPLSIIRVKKYSITTLNDGRNVLLIADMEILNNPLVLTVTQIGNPQPVHFALLEDRLQESRPATTSAPISRPRLRRHQTPEKEPSISRVEPRNNLTSKDYASLQFLLNDVSPVTIRQNLENSVRLSNFKVPQLKAIAKYLKSSRHLSGSLPLRKDGLMHYISRTIFCPANPSTLDNSTSSNHKAYTTPSSTLPITASSPIYPPTPSSLQQPSHHATPTKQDSGVDLMKILDNSHDDFRADDQIWSCQKELIRVRYSISELEIEPVVTIDTSFNLSSDDINLLWHQNENSDCSMDFDDDDEVDLESPDEPKNSPISQNSERANDEDNVKYSVQLLIWSDSAQRLLGSNEISSVNVNTRNIDVKKKQLQSPYTIPAIPITMHLYQVIHPNKLSIKINRKALSCLSGFIVVQLVKSKDISPLLKEIYQKSYGDSQFQDIPTLNKHIRSQPLPGTFPSYISPTQSSDCEDIIYSSEFVTLMDPVTLKRITHPAKTAGCKHSGCFDLMNFLIISREQPKFQCPICSLPITPENPLEIDKFIKSILCHYPSATSIQFHSDGSYTVPN
ncbi:hypothetical protein BKA69DRAFT_1082997 [Paraphysoderma sedebokerense]|nr:hypothetical protein BKA69DRAFT_1082963 [Paraphysoderma sedebokerense]KAI9139858.1 hypothetical protein BKA69DRAFT_1082997 [Paraphysoderma sedebokerense]